jgi:pimeloyl-ACP methyl ester carboxylesterase
MPAEELSIPSDRGLVRALYDPPRRGRPVVIMVGGFDGGFEGPADGLFPRLAEGLGEHGIGALRVDFIDRVAPGIVENGARDVRAAIAELKRRGVSEVALVGHSFGAAVMITVAAEAAEVRAVAALSTQTAGVQGAPRIAPRPLLLVHGIEDLRLPPDCSRYVYAIAREPKELVLLEGARHSLRQRKHDVYRLLLDWLLRHLGDKGASAPEDGSRPPPGRAIDQPTPS